MRQAFQKILTIAAALLLEGATLVACQSSNFAGEAPQRANDDSDGHDDNDGEDDRTGEDQLGQTATDSGLTTATGVGTGIDGLGTGTDGGPGEPVGLDTTDGRLVATPDYSGCAALPEAGKRGYGKCDAGQVVVIVNDGKAQEMTCCPVKAQNVLSIMPDEQNVQRVGLCLADEVATGMVEPHAPGVYCTKINTQFMQLSAPVVSTYVNGSVPGVMGQIAATYNVSDTCICPEGFVVIGGHTAQDNQCADQCVRLERRP